MGTADWDAARVWDAASGRLVWKLAEKDEPVRTISFDADHQRVVTASDDGILRLWDLRTGGVLTRLGGQGVFTVASFSPDGRFIAAGAQDGTVHLIEADTWAELRVLRTHQAKVNSVAFSSTGARLVTSSNDGTARLWDVQTGLEILQLVGHDGAVNDAAFSPDASQVATASDDATARLWDPGCEWTCTGDALISFAQERVTRELTPQEQQQFLHGN